MDLKNFVFPSIWNRSSRNALNELIKNVNSLDSVVNKIVIDDVLTEEQYFQVLSQLQRLVKKGELKISDINFNEGLISLSMLSTEVKEAMAGETPILSEIADEAVTTQKIANEAVTAEKVGFFDRAKNLLTLENITQSTSISDATGELVVHNTYDTTDYIEISSGQYSLNKTVRWALYGEGMEYIQGQSSFSAGFNAPTGAKYVRLAIRKTDIHEATLVTGTVPLVNYESPYPKLKEMHLPEIENAESKNGRWFGTSGMLDFNFIEGRIISDNSQANFIISGDKRYNLPSQTIDLSSYNARYYNIVYDVDSNKINLLRDTIMPTDSQILFGFIDKTSQRIYAIDNCYVNGGLIGQPKDLRNKDFNVFTDGLDKHFSLPKNIKDYAEIESMTLVDVYEMFDSLMNLEDNYITKSEIGEDKDGNKIYRYDFKPAYPDKTYPSDNPKVSKIVITSAMHGSEKATVPVMYEFFKTLIEEWHTSELLESFRFDYEFTYIPIANPSGWISNTRKNSNGVDLNRNFPSLWTFNPDASSSTYGGSAPLTEPEALAIYDMLLEEENMLMFIDFHNFSSNPDNRKFIWNMGASLFGINVGNRYIQKLSREWQKKYNFLPQNNDDFFGWSSHAVNGGVARFAETLEPHGYLFEICETLWTEPNPTKFSSNVMTLGLEALINFLRYQLKNILAIQSRND